LYIARENEHNKLVYADSIKQKGIIHTYSLYSVSRFRTTDLFVGETTCNTCWSSSAWHDYTEWM